MQVIPFVAESLGDSSYLVVDGDEAAVIDPQRDIRPFLAAAEAHGARIVRAIETHVHNDYISGGPALASLGATVVAPRKANLDFPHHGVEDRDTIRLGNVLLRAVATPGHTYEHTAYLLLDPSGTVHAAFSGGNLLVSAAGRSDLLGPEHTDELLRLQWESGHRLAAMLELGSAIFPTHGAGSFCSLSAGPAERTTQLARERVQNPILSSPTFEAFRALQLAVPQPTPAYYRHMAPINRAGERRETSPPQPPALTPSALVELRDRGVPIIDLRARQEWAASHVPGSLALEECPSLLGYVSWLFPFDSELALVTYDAHQAERVTTDLFRIGYERVRGFLPFHVWLEQGHDSDSFPALDVARAAEMVRRDEVQVIDVRFEREHLSEPLAGARQLPIDRIQSWAGSIGEGPVVVICASGQRATIVASYLAARGIEAIPLIRGGASDVSREISQASL